MVGGPVRIFQVRYRAGKAAAGIDSVGSLTHWSTEASALLAGVLGKFGCLFRLALAAVVSLELAVWIRRPAA